MELLCSVIVDCSDDDMRNIDAIAPFRVIEYIKIILCLGEEGL